MVGGAPVGALDLGFADQTLLGGASRDALGVSVAADTADGDVDGDGKLEILVNLKDPDGTTEVLVYGVDSAQTNCVLWSTGRGNFARNAWVR